MRPYAARNRWAPWGLKPLHAPLPLPVFGKELKDDDVWKILAYVRSLYRGDPSKVNR
jgi:hypothetical protein